MRSQTETPKRYRYTGKERDEESGLYYHGARYYAPWLGRWIQPDPQGTADSPDLYQYARDNPTRYRDMKGRAADDPNVLALGLSNVPLRQQQGLKGIRSAAEESLPGRAAVDIESLKSWPKSFEENFGSGSGVAGREGFLPGEPGGTKDIARFGAETAAKWEKFKGLGSAVVVQEALEALYEIHFDLRGVDPLRAGQTGSELRSVISALATGDLKEAVHFLHEGGLSTIRGGARTAEGASLPERILQHLPPSFRSSPSGVAGESSVAGSTLDQISKNLQSFSESLNVGGKLKNWATEGWNATLKWGPKALKFAGTVASALGAEKVARDYRSQIDDPLGQSVVMWEAFAAGAVDDAIFATGVGAPLVTEWWEREGAGPSQVAVRDFNLWLSRLPTPW